jgi:hypothetical protein
MNRKRWRRGALVIGCCLVPVQAHFDLSCKTNRIKKPEGTLIHNFLYDMAALQYEFFSLETLKLLLIFGPLYGAARIMDPKVHHYFYNDTFNKNMGCVPKKISRSMQAIPIAIAVGYSLFVFNSWSDELAVSARVFAAGLIPLELLKKLLKKTLHFNPCLRPKSEFFDCSKRCFGGLPGIYGV